MRRRFNTSERVAAYLIADGKCEDCGAELEPGWHGDHDTPYSLGGATDATNIRALCPACNLKKGNRMRKPVREWLIDKELHDWQQAAFNKLMAHHSKEFLCVAWPGTGKTLFALYVAHWLYRVGDIGQIIVIVPSTSLREQWSKSARSIGIDLDYEFENKASAIASDFHGVVVTDASVYREPAFYRRLSTKKPTLVIPDECHHCGVAQDDEQGWGDALSYAFEAAYFKLSLSGTPFRSDNKQIPFVKYDNGVSVPDYYYSYGNALADGVVRELYFPRFEGDMSWLDDDEYYQHSFGDEVNKRQESNRLRTALLKGPFLDDLIGKQHSDLMDLRAREHPNASGLITCIDTDHTKEVAEKVRRITGFEPVIVHSKHADAHDRIKRFGNSSDPWLIAVKMVTEGVDIPNLRVGVYASNVIAELSIIQFLGRFVRKLHDEKTDDWWSSVAFPSDRRFIEIIERLKQERNHELIEGQKKNPRNSGAEPIDPRAGYVGHEATARPDGFGWDERSYQQSLVDKYAPLRRRHKVPMTDEQFTAFAVDMQELNGSDHADSNPPPFASSQVEASPDLNAIQKLKRAQANRQAFRLDKLLGVDPGFTNTRWKIARGGHDGASIEDLDKKLAWLEARIWEATNDGK